MAKYKKDYIGGGKEVTNGIVRVTIDVGKAESFIYDYNGKKYLTFNVDKNKEPDKYGKTHSVYVSTKEEN